MRLIALSLLGAALLCTSTAHASQTAPGAKVFEDQCSDCHSMEAGKHKRGPSLAGVVGRPSGSAQGYHYTDAMAGLHTVWTPARLTQYLASPKTDVPGTKMRLLIHPKPEEINALIGWLQQQK